MTTNCQAASGRPLERSRSFVRRLRLGSRSGVGKSDRLWSVSQLLRGGYTVRIPPFAVPWKLDLEIGFGYWILDIESVITLPPLHNPNLIIAQSVQLVNQPIDLVVVSRAEVPLPS